MTQEEKIVRRTILVIKIQMFLWGFSWCAAFGEFWRIIFWDGDFLHPVLFAVNAAYGIHFYPFKGSVFPTKIKETNGGKSQNP